MKRIAIIRLSSLGDIVHALPAVASIKRDIPQSIVSWFVEPPGDMLVQNFGGIDEIVPVRLRGLGLFEAIGNARRAGRQHGGPFDWILDFQGLIKSALLSRFFRGEHLGFHRANLREPLAALAYSRRAEPFDETRHVIQKNLHLLTMIGIHDQTVGYPLKKNSPSDSLQGFLQLRRFQPKSWIALNVGGGWPSKVLQPEQWQELIRRLAGRWPLLLLWGNEPERLAAETIAEESGTPLSPRLDFLDLIWFIEQSALLVSADSLPLHLADAVGTPSLGLFGPTNPLRNGSMLPGSLSLWEDVGCNFCYRRKCDTIRCMKSITTGRMVEAIQQMMSRHDRVHH